MIRTVPIPCFLRSGLLQTHYWENSQQTTGYKAVVRACCYCRGVEASSPQAWHCVTLLSSEPQTASQHLVWKSPRTSRRTRTYGTQLLVLYRSQARPLAGLSEDTSYVLSTQIISSYTQRYSANIHCIVCRTWLRIYESWMWWCKLLIPARQRQADLSV